MSIPNDLLEASWKLIIEFDYARVSLENIDKTQFEIDNASTFILLTIDNVINKYQEIKTYLNINLINALLDAAAQVRKQDPSKQESLKIILGHLNPDILNAWIDNFIIVIEDILQDQVSIDQLQLWKIGLSDVVAIIIGAKAEKKRKMLTQIFDKKKNNTDALKKPWDLVLQKKLTPESIQLTNEDLRKMLGGSNRQTDPVTIFHFQFYDLLFKKEPTMAAMFPEEMTQRKAFVKMMEGMIFKSSKLEDNSYYFKKLGRRHMEEYQVEKKHLEAFAESLLETFEIILSDEFGFTAKKAWKHAFSTIINAMIEGFNEKESRLKAKSTDNLDEKVSQIELRNMRRSWELVKNMNLDPKRLKFKTFDMKSLFDQATNPSNMEYFVLKMYDNLFFEVPSLRYYFPNFMSLKKMFDGLFDVILIKFENSTDFQHYAKNLGRIHLELHKINGAMLGRIKDATLKTLQEFLLEKLSANLLKSWRTCFEVVIQFMIEGQKESLSDDDKFANILVNQFSEDKIEIIRNSWELLLEKTIPYSSFKLKCSDQLLLTGINKSGIKIQTMFCVKYYDNLLWEYSEFSTMYNSPEKQRADFASLLFTITEKLEFVDFYEDKIREQGRKNSEISGIKPQFYECQERCLIATLKEFLGEEFDLTAFSAWKQALNLVGAFMIEGPKIRRRAETNSMLKRPAPVGPKICPLQIKLISRSWEKLVTLKIDPKNISLNYFPKDTLEFQKSATTIFSFKYYDNLFTTDKEFVKFFPDVMSQSKAFGGLISLVVKKLEQIEEHEDKIREHGKQHEEWGVRPDMFTRLTSCLLQTMREFLLSEFDIETEEAWSSALDYLTDLMIEGPQKKLIRNRRLSENIEAAKNIRSRSSFAESQESKLLKSKNSITEREPGTPIMRKKGSEVFSKSSRESVHSQKTYSEFLP
eukprot:NODE_160_length_15021_cov_0.894786.p1 type:complete len:922 gc:universal NODE_160_length_15021_cov_0.894786:12115-9350(-)